MAATSPDAWTRRDGAAQPDFGASYRAPRWLGGAGAAGGNLQTIWPVLALRHGTARPPAFRRERWTTPDGDFIDVDWLEPVPTAAASPAGPRRLGLDEQPLLICFHGLEGSSGSHYALALAHAAAARGWRYAVPHFRGCSGSLNLAPRAYHAGDHVEIGWILQRFAALHAGPRWATGVSLGGNALLRWAALAGHEGREHVQGLAAVCAPLDLAAAGAAIGRGFNRHVYGRMFLKTMLPKALAKWQQHPGLFDRDGLRRVGDLRGFDDLFTAPLHGFRGVEDYWRQASSGPLLPDIRLPALVLNSLNDPFVPHASLPAAVVGDWVSLARPAHGGHVGFPARRFPGTPTALPQAVLDWLAATR